jgi:hypothetical protein
MAITLNSSGITLANLAPKGGQVRYFSTTRTQSQTFGSSAEWATHMTLNFVTYVKTNALFIFSPSIAYESTSAPTNKSCAGQVRFLLDGVPFGNILNWLACGEANSGCTAQPAEAYNNMPAGNHVLSLQIRNYGLTEGYTALDSYNNPYWVPPSLGSSTIITPYSWASTPQTNLLVGMIFGDGYETNLYNDLYPPA